MSNEINLTGNEWDIMKIIWAKQPCTLRQICDEINKQHSWTRHAVISFLKRMEIKGAIKVEDSNPKNYRAAIKQDEAIKEKLDNTLSRVFDDNPLAMVSYLAKSNKISDEDIEQMIAVLKGGLSDDQ